MAINCVKNLEKMCNKNVLNLISAMYILLTFSIM